MALRDDPLNPDQDSGLIADQGFYKSASQAFQQDVAPRAFGIAKPEPVQVAAGPKQTLADVMGLPAPAQPAPEPKSLADVLGLTVAPEAPPQSPKGDFSRGFEVSGKQLKQTLYGTAALIGDTIGATGVKEWGLKGYKDAEKEVQAISKPTDEFTEAWENGGLGKWLTYSSGYLLGQVAEMGAASLAGAVAGSAVAPGAGTVAGAVGGAIEKGAAQAGVKALVGKLIDKEAQKLVASGVAKELAAETATKTVYRTIGATTANTFLNATQELGSIYGDAVQEAISKGEDYSLGKVWLSGIAATAVDSWADSKALGQFVGGVKGRLGRTAAAGAVDAGKGAAIKEIALEALKGGFREGMTEGVQTAIERWGADKDLASQEAFKDYINSAAVGILGGGVGGATSGAVNQVMKPSQPTDQGKPAAGQEDVSLPPSAKQIDRADTTNLPVAREEALSALQSPAAMAYLYQTGTPEQRVAIEKSMQRYGDLASLEDIKTNKTLFAQGEEMLGGDQETLDRIHKAVGIYANSAPLPGTFKAQKRKSTSAGIERLDEMDAATQVQEVSQPIQNNTADASVASAPTVVTPPAQTTVAQPATTLEEEVRAVEQGSTKGMQPVAQPAPNVTEDERARLTGYFEGEAQRLLGMKYSAKRKAGLEQLQTEAITMGYQPEQISRLLTTGSFGEPATQVQQTPEQRAGEQPTKQDFKAINAELQAAKEELGDAFYNLWDVASDIGGSKLKAVGEQKRTVAELPKAMQKVMESLVKLGYVKFKDVVRELMARMRESKDWYHLVDKVTPRMLRDAYNNLKEFDGKEAADAVNSTPREEIAQVVKKPVEDRPSYRQGDRMYRNAKGEMVVVTDQRPINARKFMEAPADGDQAAPEMDLGTYTAAPKKTRKKLTPSETTPSMREYLQTLTGKDQADAQQAFANMTEEQRTAWENRYLESKAKADERAAEEAKARKEATRQAEIEMPEQQRNTKLAELEQRVSSIMNLSDQAQVWKETKQRIVDAIDEIDQKLREGQYLTVGDKSFKAVDQSDENAYLWGDQGFRTAKNLPQDRLLAIRRGLMEDLQAMREQSSRGLAALFQRSMRHLEYQLAQARSQAVAQGLSPTEADSVVAPSAQFIREMLKEAGRTDTGESAGRPLREMRRDRSAENATQSIYETDKSREGAERRRERDNNLTDEALMARMPVPGVSFNRTIEQYGGGLLDAIQEDMDEARAAAYRLVGDLKSGKVKDTDALKFAQQAMRDRVFTFGDLVEAMRASGYDIPRQMLDLSGQVALQSSMVDFVRENGDKHVYREQWLRSMQTVVKANPDAINNFSAAERTAYELWNDRRQAIAQRRNVDDVMLGAVDVQLAFPNLLFTNYSLSQMRNPTSIPERERAALQAMVGDLETAWFQDVAFALKTRPTMREAITGADGVIAPTEVEQFRQWVARHEKAVLKDAEVNARAPYLQQLLGMDALPQEMFDKFRTRVLAAQMDELPVIMANAQKLNDSIGQRSLTAGELELLIGDYVDNVMQEEMIGGQTIDEHFGVKEFGQAEDTREESVEDLANSDEGFNFNDEYDQAGGDPDELRFKRAAKPFFNGVVTAAKVQAAVARILSTFKNAPNVVVLRNVMQLPDDVRARVVKQLDAGMGAKGLFDPKTGTVYMFSDMLASDADVEFTLFHEVYGHLGMRALLGAKFDSFLENMYRVYPGIRKATDALIADGTPRLEAIEEVLADMAGENREVGAVKQFVGKMIAGLREIGLNRVADWVGKLTNAELAYHLDAARNAARNGGVPAIGGEDMSLRFSQAERIYEMFSQRDGKTKAYARFNPITQSWILFRAMGEDIRDNAGYITTNHDDYEQLLKRMQAMGNVQRRKRSGLFVDEKIPSDMVKLTELTNLTGMKRWMRDQITRFQNEYRPVFDLVESLRNMGRVNEDMDVRTALELYERRTGAVIESFRENFVTPIMSWVDSAKAKGASYDDINKFLLARHAEERNRQIASINPKMQDGGSGMKTGDAKKYLSDLQNEPFYNELLEIGRLTDKMSEAKINYQVRMGMISSKNYTDREGNNVLGAAELMKRYKHYVNLSGVSPELDQFDDPAKLVGTKFNVKGVEKRAMGRGSEATDILARTILGMEAALIRGQKNLVAQKVLALLENNYDPNFAVINEVAYKRVIGEDGQVQEKEDESYIRDKSVMVAKVNGVPVTIKFKDTTAGSFAEAIHGMVYPPEANAFMEGIGKFNRIVGQMLTTYNPAWAPVNFLRDAQTLFFNAASDNRITKAQAARMMGLLPKAIKVAYFMASNRGSGVSVDPALMAAYKEMKAEGGLTTFLNRKGLEDQVQDIHEMLGETSKFQHAKDKFGKVLEMIEGFTTPMEIAPRLAAYMVAKEGGMSRNEAAKFAGEITVNFNMRGNQKWVRQLYLFFNPALQGTAKLGSLFFTINPDYSVSFNGKKASMYAAAMVGFGAMMNLVARAMGDDDDAGRNDLDKLPVYKRATSAVIIPNTPFGAIPIPYGWNAFYALGHFSVDTLLGIQPASETAKRVAQTAFESFSPLGSAGLDSKSIPGTILKGVSPTATLPIVEWVMNENRYGAPIYRDDSLFGGAKLPNSESAFRSVSPISQSIARGLNEMTGGNRAKSGAVDINPAAIDYLIGSYTPGLINETYKGAGTAVRVAKGEEVKNTPLPLIGRFTATVPESFDAGSFRRVKELSETLYNEYKQYPDRRTEMLQETPGLLRAHAIVSSATQELRQARAAFNQYEAKPWADADEVTRRKNRLMEQEKRIYARVAKAAIEAGPDFKNAAMAAD